MRFLVLALAALPLLAGCNSILRQDGDYFEASGKDPGRFEADAQACGVVAADYVTYDLKGMDGTGYARTRAYNQLYARCMTGRGYAPRSLAENWLPAS